MKKNLLAIVALLFMCISALPSFGLEIDLMKEGKSIHLINEVGFRLLNANNIDKKVAFRFNNSLKIPNAGAYVSPFYPREITVTKGLLLYCDSDDELAGVLGHEISHISDSYQGILRGSLHPLAYRFAPRKYEYKADKRAVDYMVKAGYNPLGYLVLMSKLMGQYRYDTIFSTHPLATRRAAEVYEYIYKKYPYFLAENAYKDNIYYQNFLLTSSENRRRLQKNIQSGSNRKTHYK